MTFVAGVDGAPEGAWVVVRVRDDHLDAMEFAPTLRAAVAACEDAKVILVDVPIGHDDPEGLRGGMRRADEAARAFLKPAVSTVFPIPIPDVLNAGTHEEAVAVAVAKGLWKPSRQAWGLASRIREAEGLALRDERILEGHPEVSFKRILTAVGGGTHLERSKATFDGFMGRLELLHAVGLRPKRSFGGLGRVGPDDVLDATALAWSARRLAASVGDVLPDPPPLDPRTNRPVAIWS